jgi:predicted  nucleic acid-binding Zn-ribbon protein
VPLTLDDYQALKRSVEELTRRRDEAKGALAQVMKDIRKDFGCKTLKEAKTLLRKLQEKEQKLYKKYTRAKAEFEEKWKEVLSGGRTGSTEEGVRPRRKVGKARKVGIKKAKKTG